MWESQPFFLSRCLRPWPGPVSARAPDVPPSQAAFRAALTKYYEKCEKETDQARFGELQRARAAAFAQALGEGLSFEGWRLERKGIEPTPRGGCFVRFIDPTMADLRAVRPTYWNGGPGKIGREAAILRDTERHDVLKAVRPGMQAIVSGRFSASAPCSATPSPRAPGSRRPPCFAGCSRRRTPMPGTWSPLTASWRTPCAPDTATGATCRTIPVA